MIVFGLSILIYVQKQNKNKIYCWIIFLTLCISVESTPRGDTHQKPNKDVCERKHRELKNKMNYADATTTKDKNVG